MSAARASLAASSLMTPSCIQITLIPSRSFAAIASRTTPINGIGGAEDIDDVDRRRHVGERRIDRLVVDGLSGETRIDRFGDIALVHKEPHHVIARPLGLLRSADDGEGFNASQDGPDVVVAQSVDMQAYRSFQSGFRFSMKAQMPSPASAVSMFFTMTSLAYA